MPATSPTTNPLQTKPATQWQPALTALSLAAFACVAVFWSTWASMVAIWWRSDTFSHGFLVLPISLWLIWIRKERYLVQQPVANPPALTTLAACGLLWLMAHITQTLVLQQWAVVGVLIASIWSILGHRLCRNLLFPILFLLFMVPFGEDFVPYLMEYTASFVVAMLRLTGISVYREGLHFTLTSGHWSVIDACSGIRYLIASLTLGWVYAYLYYNRYWKRACFMLASIVLPILANGMRAYLIVLIGHLSDMKLATGIDHLIYGWLFFGIVMLLLFYAGSFWRDEQLPFEPPPSNTTDSDRHYTSLTAILILVMAIWPLTAAWLNSQPATPFHIPDDLARSRFGQWQAAEVPAWEWEPRFNGVTADRRLYLSNGSTVAGLYIAGFGSGSQGGELVNSQNRLIEPHHPNWRVIKTGNTTLTLPNHLSIDVKETQLNSPQRDLLILRWYRIGGRNTANDYYAKWLQLRTRLSGDHSSEWLMVLFTEVEPGQYQQALDNLRNLAQSCCVR